MVPRPQVTGLPVNATLTDVRNAFASTGYSRLPVYGSSPDDIIGLLFRKDVDMGRINTDGFQLQDFVRAPTFIPATASLGEALRRMQSARVHFVFVIDEHGGMEGILTLRICWKRSSARLTTSLTKKCASRSSETARRTCSTAC